MNAKYVPQRYTKITYMDDSGCSIWTMNFIIYSWYRINYLYDLFPWTLHLFHGKSKREGSCLNEHPKDQILIFLPNNIGPHLIERLCDYLNTGSWAARKFKGSTNKPSSSLVSYTFHQSARAYHYHYKTKNRYWCHPTEHVITIHMTFQYMVQFSLLSEDLLLRFISSELYM